jgi:uncharacterized protein
MQDAPAQTIGMTFRTKRKRYYYDTWSNEIFEINAHYHDVLAALCDPDARARKERLADAGRRWGGEATRAVMADLEEKTAAGFMMGPMPERYQTQKDAESGQVERRPNALYLEVTENCNLDCAYCCFSAKFSDERVGSTRNMSEETAHAAMDEFFSKAFGDATPQINFYGGEPLMRLGFIIGCMEYARKRRPDCIFGMTTNAVLLTPEAFMKIRPFEPRICVSMDGPASVHDRQRRTRNDRGTHHKVMANLRKIFDRDEAYFRTCIVPLAVISRIEDIPVASRYYARNRILKQVNTFKCFPVNQCAISQDCFDEDLAFLEARALASRRRYLRALRTRRETSVRFEQTMFTMGPLRQVLTRRMAPIPRTWSFTNLCRIGDDRIMVAATGNYRICEKVDRLPYLGSARTGLDQDALRRMETDFMKVSGPCRTCWALRVCHVCFINMYASRSGGIHLDPAIMKTACREWLARTTGAFELAQEIQEIDPAILGRLARIAVS